MQFKVTAENAAGLSFIGTFTVSNVSDPAAAQDAKEQLMMNATKAGVALNLPYWTGDTLFSNDKIDTTACVQVLFQQIFGREANIQVEEISKPTVMVNIDISSQQICDLFITFIESGFSTYWCDEAEFLVDGEPANYQLENTFAGNNWSVIVKHDDGETNEITPESLVRAFSKAPERMARVIDETSDAEDADVLIQYAALGDIVYG